MVVKRFCDKCGVLIQENSVGVNITGLRTDVDRRKQYWISGDSYHFELCGICSEGLLQDYGVTTVQKVVEERIKAGDLSETIRKCIICKERKTNGIAFRDDRQIRFVCGNCLYKTLKNSP